MKLGSALLWVYVLVALIGSICWPYTINTWLVFGGKPPVVQWWHGAIISLVPYVGKLSLPLAALTYVFMLFV